VTPKERAAYADQLMSNPLFAALFDGIEHEAIEAMICAVDDATRAREALRVQAVRDLRHECVNSLTVAKPRTGAPA